MKRLFEFAAATSVRSPALATFGLLALAACSSERQIMDVDVADVPLAFRARLRRTPWVILHRAARRSRGGKKIPEFTAQDGKLYRLQTPIPPS